jgi:protein-S-isoprenylcysteine O-methyltransferase Ste14
MPAFGDTNQVIADFYNPCDRRLHSIQLRAAHTTTLELLVMSTKFDFPTLLFIAGFIVYVLIRARYEGLAKGIPIASSRAEADKPLLIPLGVAVFGLPILYFATDCLRTFDVALPMPIRLLGLLIMVCALWLFQRSHADLGRNWSVTLEIHSTHELITNGVYAHVRHPMYAAIFLFSLAQGMILNNMLVGWAALTIFSVVYLIRVPREEAMMRAHFGHLYEAYVQRTGRLLPHGITDYTNK